MRSLLYPEWLIDGSGNPPLHNQVVVLEGDRITAVEPAATVAARPDDTVSHLPETTLLPGLINNHVHLVLPGDNTPFLPWADLQSDATLALWAEHNAQVSLRAGITTVRDCGGRKAVVINLRDAQRLGVAGGAQVITCGWPITITGGHTRFFGGEVDGIDGVTRMVRYAVSLGVDFIKVMGSGGGTPGSLAQFPAFKLEEMRAIVETAHGLGRKVCVHCIATDSIRIAVEAGVDLIEHAMFYGPDGLPHYDERVAEQLAQAGIPVTPTMQVNRDMIERTTGPEQEGWLRRREGHQQAVDGLRRLGVPLLAGSDAGWRATSFDSFWKELDELASAGMTPVQAVRAATAAVTAALGMADEFGAIKPGQRADLLIAHGDVSTDLSYLQQVHSVYQNGELVV
ncbi:MAG: amidohydrolase family protein [Oscillochloris sp.]|nr:amidohydrolase family protein [Oscillochloris sp.]